MTILDKLLKTSNLILNYIVEINGIRLKSKQELLNFFQLIQDTKIGKLGSMTAIIFKYANLFAE